MPRRLKALLHWLFEASLLAKGVLAAGEALAGILLLVIRNDRILPAVRRLTRHELSEDPHDRIANMLLGAAHALSLQTQSFYGLYFLSHGVLKLAVVMLLARGVLWAYPMAVALLSGFILYQLYLWSFSHAPSMLVLSALDLIVIALTVQEWRSRR